MKTKHHQKRKAEFKGRLAEHWVSLILRLQGFRKLHQRYRNPYGEIDLIFYRGSLLLFIEVKLRSGFRRHQHDYDMIEHAMPSALQQKRLARAAIQFWHQHPEHHHRQFRFDLVVVHPSGGLTWFTDSIKADK